MLRLDTYPEAQIATHMKPESTPSPLPTLCCLLHTGALPSSQDIQVWVGGTQQRAEQEGTQQVFSWQCTQGIEMGIHLMQHGRLAKAWRGWWQGETTIAHTGNLPIQVFCAGASQPAGLAPAPSTGLPQVFAVTVDQHNGSHPETVSAVRTWPAVPEPSLPLLPPTEAGPEDDLWSYSPQASPADIVGGREDVAPEENLLEEEDWQETAHEDAIPEEEGVPGKRQESEGETVYPEITAASTAHVQTAAPAGTMLASLPAPTVWSQPAHQEAETRLTTLLATMPPNTVLVDLRQHKPTPHTRRGTAKSGPQKLGLSKELLRTLYGGRYWDRGAAIQTTRHLKSAHPARWCRIVINPDDPDGLGALVTALEQGFSLVVLDGESSYAESARAAVLSELRQRVANLGEGSCS